MYEQAQKECSELYPDYNGVPVARCAKCVANSLCGKEDPRNKKETW
jgi:hypothetical protein